jgi:DNA polymerase-3 subunit gamma/tau
MSHRALTLKYRPQVFADLVGQEHVTRVLSAGLASGRIAQAFLFTGARGVGKTTSARILAKAVNCENRKPGVSEPCGKCTSCTEIAAGVSLDVLEIDGASNRGIADVQQLRENVRFAPTGGRHRVVIIDEVHQLSSDAFAALLKTLEEPPAHLVFIFATTDPQKLPDTIRSRTQRYDFARVPIRRVADRLLEIQKREAADADGVKFTLTDGAALLIAHKGEGSMRDAVSALDQVVSSGEPAIDEAIVRRVLGIADREAYFRIAGAVLARDPQATLRELHAAFDKGIDARELAEGLAEHFRNVLVLKVDGERGHELVAASNEDLTRLESQGEGWADTDLLRLMRLAAECQWPMRDSPQPLVHLEAAVLQMATLEPAESVAVLLERLESIEQRLNGGASATGGSGASRGAPGSARTHGFAAPPAAVTSAPRASEPAPIAPAPPAMSPARAVASPATAGFSVPRATIAAPAPPAAPTASAPAAFERPQASAMATATLEADALLDGGIEATWKQAVTTVNGQKRMLGAFLEESRLVGVTGDTLLLAMDDLHRSVIDTAEHRPIVQEALAQAFGRPIALRCTSGTPVAVEKRAATTEASVKPLIDKAIEMFDGEVIERAPRGGERST